MGIIIDNTPWEVYDVQGIDVYVKREDLCCPEPGPSFSKIRGVERLLRKLPSSTLVGVMDTRHSKAGWGVSWVCKELGLKCIDFYPVLKADNGLRDNQLQAQAFGAELHPMKAGMSAVLYNRAKSIMVKKSMGYMLPNGLKLHESVDATAEELINYTPSYLHHGTWVVSISSGTIAAGAIKGLERLNFDGLIVCHMGYSRSHDTTRKYLQTMSGSDCGRVHLVDEDYQYKDALDNSWIPFPCNEYYDAKAFTWLVRNINKLRQPVVFWNIGA
jgi:1-aminocyclopropane-1-carboxylate deaminase/D-cysteine desulfhydrase-like pyridoxal-dependent ACC family enzyme